MRLIQGAGGIQAGECRKHDVLVTDLAAELHRAAHQLTPESAALHALVDDEPAQARRRITRARPDDRDAARDRAAVVRLDPESVACGVEVDQA